MASMLLIVVRGLKVSNQALVVGMGVQGNGSAWVGLERTGPGPSPNPCPCSCSCSCSCPCPGPSVGVDGWIMEVGICMGFATRVGYGYGYGSPFGYP